MTYTYKCEKCNHEWDCSLSMADRDVPIGQPCVQCKEESYVKRIFSFAPSITSESAMTLQQRAGSGWNDVLTKIKKKSGRYCTIQTR
jgi:predicted nucleic acid-binding Zn ribbon protein